MDHEPKTVNRNNEIKYDQKIGLGNKSWELIRSVGTGAVSSVSEIRGESGDIAVLKLPRGVVNEDGINLGQVGISENASGLLRDTVVNDSKLSQTDRLTNLNLGIKSATEADRIILSVAREGLVLGVLDGVPGVVKSLDCGLVDGVPYSIQEMAPPVLSFEKQDGLGFERDVLDKVLQVAKTIEAVHKKGVALLDFEPGTKWDRIRYNNTTGEVSIIDWNVSGQSDRIMVGGVDVDMVYLGGHLTNYLTGNAPPCLKGKFQNGVNNGNLKGSDLPNRDNTGVGVPGWDKLSDASRYLITKMMCNDPEFRYKDISEAVTGIEEILKIFDLVSENNNMDILDMMWDLKSSCRYEEIIMIANMVPEPNKSDEIIYFRDNVKKELEKVKILPYARIMGTIGTGSYAKARGELVNLISTSRYPDIVDRCKLNLLCLDAVTNLQEVSGVSDIRTLPRGDDLAYSLTNYIHKGEFNDADNIINDLLNSLKTLPADEKLRNSLGVLTEVIGSYRSKAEAKELWSKLSESESSNTFGEQLVGLISVQSMYIESAKNGHGIETLKNSAEIETLSGLVGDKLDVYTLGVKTLLTDLPKYATLDMDSKVNLSSSLVEARITSGLLIGLLERTGKNDLVDVYKNNLRELDRFQNLIDGGGQDNGEIRARAIALNVPAEVVERGTLEVMDWLAANGGKGLSIEEPVAESVPPVDVGIQQREAKILELDTILAEKEERSGELDKLIEEKLAKVKQEVHVAEPVQVENVVDTKADDLAKELEEKQRAVVEAENLLQQINDRANAADGTLQSLITQIEARKLELDSLMSQKPEIPIPKEGNQLADMINSAVAQGGENLVDGIIAEMKKTNEGFNIDYITNYINRIDNGWRESSLVKTDATCRELSESVLRAEYELNKGGYDQTGYEAIKKLKVDTLNSNKTKLKIASANAWLRGQKK